MLKKSDSQNVGDKEGNKNKEAKVICYIKVKKETTIWNLLALCIAPSITVAVGAYVNT